jgi:AmmeMemoRadiSam system protein A
MTKTLLLDIVKNSIEEELYSSSSIDKESLLQDYPELNNQLATFVTLNLNNNLRGCIGSIIPQRAIIDDLIQNAKAAAFSDPRFEPLTIQEYKDISIEISLLTIPEEVVYSDISELKDKIAVGVDGIILLKDNNHSTFLPQVWEQLPTFEEFFAHLCQKARLQSSCIDSHPEIYKYQVEKIS